MISSRPFLVLLAVAGIAGPLAVLSANPPPDPVTQVPAAFSALPASIAEPRSADDEMAGREGSPAPAPTYEDLTRTGVVAQGDGRLERVMGGTEPVGSGPLTQYTVSVEGGLGIAPSGFAAAVDAILADPRSWGAGGRRSFQRVDTGEVDFRVVLASPRTTDRLCAPLTTEGTLSCGIGGVAVINALRWQRGADAYEGRLPNYREYVINHEVGHTLGFGHLPCPGPGQPAPVMMQQTIGIGACTASPWPYPTGS